MDNYKIKVNDEAESKEAQVLFEQLGYSNGQSKRFGFVYTQNGEIGCDSMEHWAYYNDLCKELTLPQLRDLVVLKRNDSRDANVNQGGEIPCLYDLYLTADKELYFYHCGKGKWLLSNLNHDEDYYATLKPIEKSHPQDPALISGADALRALADGKEVEYNWLNQKSSKWMLISEELKQFNLYEILSATTEFGAIKFRLKPQTIKVELELPKPFEPEEDCHVYILDDGKTDGYRRYSYEVHGDKGNTFIGIWKTEDEIKQVVEQLRKIRGAS
ncbi:hypothetical protein V7O15_002402 [Acinetobacter baumannii]